jgi:hypothetical protein
MGRRIEHGDSRLSPNRDGNTVGLVMARRPLLLIAVATLALLVAVPALAGQPSAAPGKSSAPGQQKTKVAKAPITISGTVESATDADGNALYTLTDDGTTYTLEAGPRWFFGADYPLKPYVGKSVTIVGEKAEGSNEVDVISVDGKALREPGKPPWAGGWKRVGSSHPGWSQEKADRMKAKFGECFPPGQCKDRSAKPDDADEPDESEAP